MTKRRPVLIDVETSSPDARSVRKRKSAAVKSPQTLDAPDPMRAPPVAQEKPQRQASAELFVRHLARKPSFWGRVFIGVAGGLLLTILATALWDFAAAVAARHYWFGQAVWGALALLLLSAVVLVLRELASLARMRRVDYLRQKAANLTADIDSENSPTAADAYKKFERDLKRFFQSRKDLTWALQDYEDAVQSTFDHDARLALLEAKVIAPLDQAAQDIIVRSSRQVALATALVPLALADVAAALVTNLRMVRQIAELYGGRGGGLGSWRLMKAVAAHLIATGALAIGDDLIGSVAGGGLLSKLSRRFGEGLINGALTARVGVAAMEICRPMPFNHQARPKVSALTTRALGGVFGSE